MRTRWLGLPLSLLSLAAACGDPDGRGRLSPPNAQPLEARLTSAPTCDALLERLREDARTRVKTDAWLMYEGRPTDVDFVGFPNGAVDAGSLAGSPTAPSAEGDSAGPRGHTETNVQVEGVDEADSMETDGDHIYVLHGGDLYVVKSWPAEASAVSHVVDIEGEPAGLFVSNGKAVVISNVWSYPVYGGPLPGIADGGPAPAEDGGPAPAEDGGPVPAEDGGPAPAEDGGFMDSDGGLPSWDGSTPEWIPDAGGTTDPGDGEADGGVDPSPGFEGPHTKITILDVSGTPTVISERWLEGSYVTARRHDDVVRVLVASYGSVVSPIAMPDFAFAGAPISEHAALVAATDWQDAALARIDASTLDDFLPNEEVRVGDAVVELAPDCSGYYLPPPGVSADGMLRVATVSTADPSAFASTTIVGRADTTYANADTLVIAQNDYRFSRFGGVAAQESALHVFALDGAATRYRASGKVAGSLSGQFAMDVTGDVLRLALTEDRVVGTPPTEPFVGFVQTTPVSSVITLRIEEGALVGLGRSQDLAPGERMQSVRFLGDRAYVVTFLRVDPLFVIDVSRPEAPTVVAELEIPGFSEYVHPLANGYLLTIGRDVDPETSFDRGLALSIFDVRDDTHPVLAHRLTIPGSSGAEWDHHDFILDTAHGVLAIPVYDYTTDFVTELALFSIDIDAGIAELGRIDHAPFFDQCAPPADQPWWGYGCWYTPAVRRGLFIDDYIYSVSYGGVLVHALADLVNAVAAVPLPQPVQTYPYYYGLEGDTRGL